MPSRGKCFYSSLGDWPCFWEGRSRRMHNAPYSPLAVSFQRNPRFRKNLIKHLLHSLIMRGMELLMKPGSSPTVCWGCVCGGGGVSGSAGTWVGRGALAKGLLWRMLELVSQPSPLQSSIHPNPSPKLTGASGLLGVDSLPQVLGARRQWIRILLT